MIQPALLGLCVSLLADLLPTGEATRLDLGAAARAELNAGRLPVASNNDSQPGSEQTITLRTGVRLISPTSSLSLIYRPQYYLRVPDALQVGRPLVLQDGALAWAARPNPRLRLSWDVRASAGELPGSSLLTIFNPGTGLSLSRVMPILRLSTDLSLTAMTGKRHTTSASINGSHNDSLWGKPGLQRSDNAALAVSHAIGLTRRTSTGLSAQAGYAAPEGVAESLMLGGQLFVEQRLSERSTVRAAGGLSQSWAFPGGPSQPLPAFDGSYRTTFNGAGQVWDFNVGGGTRAFFDAAAARYRPQAFVSASLDARILQVWTIGSTLSFSTDISGAPASTTEQPTQFNFFFPVTYRIDDNLRLLFGMRAAVTASSRNVEGGGVQDQISFFMALDWSTGTERTRGGWL